MSLCIVIFFCKQKTAYEMRISDWSSDVCSSDLAPPGHLEPGHDLEQRNHVLLAVEEVVVEVLHGTRAERVLEVGEVMLEPRRGRQVGGAAEHRRDAAEGAVEAAAGRYLVGHGAVARVRWEEHPSELRSQMPTRYA